MKYPNFRQQELFELAILLSGGNFQLKLERELHFRWYSDRKVTTNSLAAKDLYKEYYVLLIKMSRR